MSIVPALDPVSLLYKEDIKKERNTAPSNVVQSKFLQNMTGSRMHFLAL